MLLTPDASWAWSYQNDSDRLGIELGPQWLFLTPYNERQVIPDGLHPQSFTSEHAEYYQLTIERIGKQLDLSYAQQVQLALNLTAAKFFSLPTMPKSWYFRASHQIAYPAEGKVVGLEGPEGLARFLLVEGGGQASLLMLIEPEMTLTASKRMKQFSLIKVMNDRLVPVKAVRKVNIVAA